MTDSTPTKMIAACPEMRVCRNAPVDRNPIIAEIQQRLASRRPSGPYTARATSFKEKAIYRLLRGKVVSLISGSLDHTQGSKSRQVGRVLDALKLMEGSSLSVDRSWTKQ